MPLREKLEKLFRPAEVRVPSSLYPRPENLEEMESLLRDLNTRIKELEDTARESFEILKRTSPEELLSDVPEGELQEAVRKYEGYREMVDKMLEAMREARLKGDYQTHLEMSRIIRDLDRQVEEVLPKVRAYNLRRRLEELERAVSELKELYEMRKKLEERMFREKALGLLSPEELSRSLGNILREKLGGKVEVRVEDVMGVSPFKRWLERRIKGQVSYPLGPLEVSIPFSGTLGPVRLGPASPAEYLFWKARSLFSNFPRRWRLPWWKRILGVKRRGGGEVYPIPENLKPLLSSLPIPPFLQGFLEGTAENVEVVREGDRVEIRFGSNIPSLKLEIPGLSGKISLELGSKIVVRGVPEDTLTSVAAGSKILEILARNKK